MSCAGSPTRGAASAVESFEIVRRRLFVEPDAAAKRDIAAVARQFVQFYAEHRGQFPRQCGEIAFEARIRAADPIHPELFDRLYEDWSTLERFQRTRGVLRLMSAVVHALWAAGDAGPLIMPGSMPLDLTSVSSELTQYLPDAWKPVIDADIDGEASTPVRIDAERSTFGQRSLTRRIARTVFIGSAPTLQTAHKGIERQHVWLGVAVPGDTVGNFGSAVEVLSQRATYLYADGGRYWYDTTASVTRTAADQADRLREHPEVVWTHLVERLQGERSARGDFAGVHVCPESSGDVPDTEEARLVVVHPQHVHARGRGDSAAMQWAQHCLDHRGSGQRVNRNTLLFLAVDSQRYEELAEATRDYLAWMSVCQRVEELRQGGQIATMYGARRVRMDLDGPLRAAWAPGHVSVGDLWTFYRRYPYLTRLRDRAVLEGALREALDDMMWESDGFALAMSYDEAASRYESLATYPSGSFGPLPDTALLVHPALALAQQEGERRPDTDPPTEEPEPGGRDDRTPVPAPPIPENVRFFGVFKVSPERYTRDLTRVAQEVLQHLAAAGGVALEVTVEVTAVKPEGFSDDKVRVVLENARTLKFDQFGFERE